MHTVGAIVLSIFGIIVMQIVLWFVSSFLFYPMYESVGIILPALLLVAFSDYSFYGGLVFALGVVPKSDPKIVGWAIASLVVVGTVYVAFRNADNQPMQITILAVFVGFGALAGTVIGSLFARPVQEDKAAICAIILNPRIVRCVLGFSNISKTKGSLLGCLGMSLPFGQRTPDFSRPRLW